MLPERKASVARLLLERLWVITGAAGLTLAFFLVLPLIQAISKPPRPDLMLRVMDTGSLPPPPPPPEEEPEKEEEPEEPPPPELEEETQPLDLSQLEMALNPGLGEGWMEGDFAIQLKTMGGSGDDPTALFSPEDLDQRPRPIYQPHPVISDKMRKKMPGTVYVRFIVDEQGRVQSPMVQSSPDPVFERPTLNAIKKWRYEPARRHGKPVRFRIQKPITFQ